MNTLNLVKPAAALTFPEAGDIFKNPDCGELFILARVPVGYTAISLRNGGHWNSERTNTLAVRGLVFIGRDAEIAVTLK